MVWMQVAQLSRDRIARYCGGFEIHCPLDAGVQISLSAPISISRAQNLKIGTIILISKSLIEPYEPEV